MINISNNIKNIDDVDVIGISAPGVIDEQANVKSYSSSLVSNLTVSTFHLSIILHYSSTKSYLIKVPPISIPNLHIPLYSLTIFYILYNIIYFLKMIYFLLKFITIKFNYFFTNW